MSRPTLAELERRFKELGDRNRAAFSQPRFAPSTLIDDLGVPRTTLTNWLHRELFDLDADRNRPGRGNHRRYSGRDAVLLAAAERLVALGVPFAVAKEVAQRICDQLMHQLAKPMMTGVYPGDKLVIYPDPDDPTKEKWIRQPKRSKSDADLPAVRIEFDVLSFIKDTTTKLGIPVAFGTAAELRRAARDHDRQKGN